MRVLKYALALLAALLLLAAPAYAIDLEPGTGAGFYVRDAANVLSPETESVIAEYNATLENNCDGAQLVVATVGYLDEDSDIAATELMNDWGVGGSQNNGMLLLLVANEYRGWLAVGDGLDSAFDDNMAGRYLDNYFWDYIDADEFDEGVRSLAEHLYGWYLEYYDINTQVEVPPSGYSGTSAASQMAGGIMVLVVFLVIFLIFLWIIVSLGRYSRMRTWGYGGGFFPIFWLGGGRRYRAYRNSYRTQPPPPPPPGPGGFGGPGTFTPPPSRSFFGTTGRSSRPVRPTSRPGGAGRRSSGFRSGGFHGGGFGGHSGGGGAGRR